MGRPRPIGCQTRRTHQAEECRKRKLQNAGDVGSVDLQAKLQKRDNRIEALETENRGLKEKTERLRIDHEAFVRQTVADKAQFFQMVQAMRQEIDLLKLRENRPDSGNYLSSRYCITSLEQSQLGIS
ncbi:hypothetical protein L596_013614 [Steinernema carpocapsae]|uniref:Uncharacterized protein n=1 Tax=Steinernema carpocapsae TaxID=34508 RepID=A0A4U5P0U3_STECR|nr:hypothetical protein L596_013614 [Steinernema carpocapsae]